MAIIRAADAPQKRSTPKTSAARMPAVTVSPRSAREEGLNGLGQVASAILVMRGLYADAGAISLHMPAVSRETAALADTNEGIAKGIDYLISMGPYSALITAIMPLALQIAANHDRIDASKAAGLGVMPPAALEAKVKAEAEALTLAVLRQASEATDKTAAAKAELASKDAA